MDQSSDENKTNDQKNLEETVRFLVFSLCKEDYAIPLLKVKEVIALPEFTPVPYSPSHFKGIMNLRGKVISIIDLREKFKMSNAEITSETAVVILDLGNLSIGVVIDSVDCVMALKFSEIQPPPDLETQMQNDYIIGVAQKDERLVLLLDIEKTLDVEDLKTVKNNQKSNLAA